MKQFLVRLRTDTNVGLLCVPGQHTACACCMRGDTRACARARTQVVDLLKLAIAGAACVVVVGRAVVVLHVVPADQRLAHIPRQLCAISQSCLMLGF